MPRANRSSELTPRTRRVALPLSLSLAGELTVPYVAAPRTDAPLSSPPAAYDYCRRLFPAHAAQEHVFAVLLDVRNQALGWVRVGVGTATASLIHPRDVFRAACLLNAAAVLLTHNHPSGDPTPSRDDDHITDRLRRAGDVLGVALLDHVVVGVDTYYSYREHGRLSTGAPEREGG